MKNFKQIQDTESQVAEKRPNESSSLTETFYKQEWLATSHYLMLLKISTRCQAIYIKAGYLGLENSIFTTLAVASRKNTWSHYRIHIKSQLSQTEPHANSLTTPHVNPEPPIKGIISLLLFSFASSSCLTPECVRPSTWCSWNILKFENHDSM